MIHVRPALLLFCTITATGHAQLENLLRIPPGSSEQQVRRSMAAAGGRVERVDDSTLLAQGLAFLGLPVKSASFTFRNWGLQRFEVKFHFRQPEKARKAYDTVLAFSTGHARELGAGEYGRVDAAVGNGGASERRNIPGGELEVSFSTVNSKLYEVEISQYHVASHARSRWRRAGYMPPTAAERGNYQEVYDSARSLLRARLGAGDLRLPALWKSGATDEEFPELSDSVSIQFAVNRYARVSAVYFSSQGAGMFSAELRNRPGTGWELVDPSELNLWAGPAPDEARKIAEAYVYTQSLVRAKLSSTDVRFPALDLSTIFAEFHPLYGYRSDSVRISGDSRDLAVYTRFTTGSGPGAVNARLLQVDGGGWTLGPDTNAMTIHTTLSAAMMKRVQKAYDCSRSLVAARLGAADVRLPMLNDLIDEGNDIVDDSVRIQWRADEETITVHAPYSSSKGSGRFTATLQSGSREELSLAPGAGSLSLESRPTDEEMKTYRQMYDKAQLLVRAKLGADDVKFPSLANARRSNIGGIDVRTPEIELYRAKDGGSVHGFYSSPTKGRGRFSVVLRHVAGAVWELRRRNAILLLGTPGGDATRNYRQIYDSVQSLVRSRLGTEDVAFPTLDDAMQIKGDYLRVENDSMSIFWSADLLTVNGVYSSSNGAGEFVARLGIDGEGGWGVSHDPEDLMLIAETEMESQSGYAAPTEDELNRYRIVYDAAQSLVRTRLDVDDLSFPPLTDSRATSSQLFSDSVSISRLDDWSMDVSSYYNSPSAGSGNFQITLYGTQDGEWKLEPEEFFIHGTPTAALLEPYQQIYAYVQSLVQLKLGAPDVTFPSIHDPRMNFGSSGASLSADSLEISGTSGDDISVNGYYNSSKGPGSFELTLRATGLGWKLPYADEISITRQPLTDELQRFQQIYDHSKSFVTSKLRTTTVRFSEMRNPTQEISDVVTLRAGKLTMEWKENETEVTANFYSAKGSGTANITLESNGDGTWRINPGRSSLELDNADPKKLKQAASAYTYAQSLVADRLGIRGVEFPPLDYPTQSDLGGATFLTTDDVSVVLDGDGAVKIDGRYASPQESGSYEVKLESAGRGAWKLSTLYGGMGNIWIDRDEQ